MDSVIKFESPSTCIIAGPSQCGKSSWVFESLKYLNGIFTKPISVVFYCYSCYQPLFDQIRDIISNVEFHEGLPTKAMLTDWANQESGHKLIILDDMLQQGGKSTDVVDIFGHILN